MLFFLDENFPTAALAFLSALGHQSERALNYFPQGTNDHDLFEKAQELGAIFLTTDKDFFHTVPFIWVERTAAVVAITLAQPNRNKILDRLSAFLGAVPQPGPGEVYLVTDSKILKRK